MEAGFHDDVIDNLIKETSDYSDIEKNVVIIFDEMKIEENLVCRSLQLCYQTKYIFQYS